MGLRLGLGALGGYSGGPGVMVYDGGRLSLAGALGERELCTIWFVKRGIVAKWGGYTPHAKYPVL